MRNRPARARSDEKPGAQPPAGHPGGEPGIGKSALVRAAVAAAPEVGCQGFWGAGDELAQPLPLQPFLEGLRVPHESTARLTARG